MSGTELTDSVHVGLTSEDKPDLVEGLDSDYFVFEGFRNLIYFPHALSQDKPYILQY